MASATKKATPRAKAGKVAKSTNKRAAPSSKKAASKSAAKPSAKQVSPTVRSPRGVVDELRVQAKLAGMERRDYVEGLVADIETRRQQVESAIDALVAGSGDAARTLADGARDALNELRDAVAKAVRTIR
jgi:hypothetical protein